MEDIRQGANEPTEELQRIVEAAFAESTTLYMNGFVNGLGLTDAYVVLQTNGRSVAVVNMSLSVAKTLGQNLLAMIERFEQQTGQPIPTLDEL